MGAEDQVVDEDQAGGEGQAGVKTWSAVLVGIVAWMVHVSALASLIELTCERPEVEWVLHLLTVVTTTVTLLGVWWCLGLTRRSGAGKGEAEAGGSDDEEAGPARLRFLGGFGVIVGGFSALLILWEGSYVLFLDPCA